MDEVNLFVELGPSFHTMFCDLKWNIYDKLKTTPTSNVNNFEFCL